MSGHIPIGAAEQEQESVVVLVWIILKRELLSRMTSTQLFDPLRGVPRRKDPSVRRATTILVTDGKTFFNADGGHVCMASGKQFAPPNIAEPNCEVVAVKTRS